MFVGDMNEADQQSKKHSSLAVTLVVHESMLQKADTSKNIAKEPESGRDALKKYRGALWSLGPSAGLIMEGMDTALTGGFFSFPSFTHKFGHCVTLLGVYEIPAL